MKKVERPEEEKFIILALPFDRRLPEACQPQRCLGESKTPRQRLTGGKELVGGCSRGSRSAARPGACAASTPPRACQTPAPWQARPGRASRRSPARTPMVYGSGACQRKPAQYVGEVGHTRSCRQRCTEHRKMQKVEQQQLCEKKNLFWAFFFLKKKQLLLSLSYVIRFCLFKPVYP